MIDERGDKTSVIVPLKTWHKMQADLAKLQNKLDVLTGIKNALVEVKHAGRSGKKLQSLNSFLREGNHQRN